MIFFSITDVYACQTQVVGDRDILLLVIVDSRVKLHDKE